MFRFTIRDVLCLMVVAALGVGFTSGAAIAEAFPSRAPAQAYVTTITRKMLDDSPAWDANDENPPLSARKAMAAANAVVAKLEPDTKSWKRRLEGLFLCQDGESNKWYWRVEYRWDPPPGTALGGLAPYMTIVVLMDGTVVQPIIDP